MTTTESTPTCCGVRLVDEDDCCVTCGRDFICPGCGKERGDQVCCREYEDLELPQCAGGRHYLIRISHVVLPPRLKTKTPHGEHSDMTTRKPGSNSPRKRRSTPKPGPEPQPAPVPAEPVPTPVQPTETLQTVAKRALRGNLKRYAIIGGGVFLLFAVIFGMCSLTGGPPPELPTPTPEPTPTVEPLPTSTPESVIVIATPTPLPPRPLNEIVPLNQQGYLEYRFYHAWEEYSYCLRDYEDQQTLVQQEDAAVAEDETPVEVAIEIVDGEEVVVPVAPTPTLEPTPAPTSLPDSLAEQAMLLNLQTEMQWLLERYDTGECWEPPQFLAMPGRIKWLLWAAGYSTGGLVPGPTEETTEQ